MKRLLTVLLSVCMVISLFVVPSVATVPGYSASGVDTVIPADTAELPVYSTDGTAELSADAYTLSSAAALTNLAQWVNEGGETFAGKTLYLNVEGSVDMTGVEIVPIGTATVKFAGTFDGLGNTIDNMQLTGDSDAEKMAVGLFGYVNGATIRNLQIGAGSSVTFSGDTTACEGVAAVVGNARSINLSNVSSAASVTSKDEASAGIIGNLVGGTSLIINCTNSGKIDVGANSGGIIGLLNGTDGVVIENCLNTGDVTNTITNGTDRIGGIVGTCNIAASSSYALVLRNCVNAGNVITNKRWAGGLIGYAAAKLQIENCTNSGNVQAYQEVGGLVGHIDSYQSNAAQGGTITNCVNTGTVTFTTTTKNVGQMAAGILARAASGVTLSGCMNFGRIYSTTGKGVGGGIVGSSQTQESTNGKVIIQNCTNYGPIDAVANNTSDAFSAAIAAGWNGGCTPEVTECEDKSGYATHVIGYQVSRVSEERTQDLRIVATIDSLEYSDVGFIITVKSGDEVVAQVSKELGECEYVYQELLAVGQTENIKAETYRPGGYLFALTIQGIPVGDGDVTYTFEVETYATPLEEGTDIVCDSTSFNYTIGSAQ